MSGTKSPRVRFAPSPTGYLHVGGLRTALFNFLFARQSHGTFILRIEDTDRTRYVEGAVENLISTLHWAGLEFDEGPGAGGSYGPYVQSERLQIYASHAAALLASGNAYRCFCTAERLDAVRKDNEKRQLPTKYDRHCLHLAPNEIETRLKEGTPHVLRMKVPDTTSIRIRDLIRGDVDFQTSQIDDQVLLKSDGYPTYHLANVVDDHLMEVSHVIRGEEWLPSTPKHVILYNAFGWTPPAFAHLPLLLNPDRSKLSKRQGDVAVEEYRAKGYLSEALVNFVALLGWNPGTEQEIFSATELVNQFSLEGVNKSGAVFNVEKLRWLNFEHLRKKSGEEVITMLRSKLASSRFSGNSYSDAYLGSVLDAMRERISFVDDLVTEGGYFFGPPASYDPDVIRKRWSADSPEHLMKLSDALGTLGTHPSKEECESALQKTASLFGVGNGPIIHAARLALSGVGGGPGVYDIMAILGRDECVKRIETAIRTITAG